MPGLVIGGSGHYVGEGEVGSGATASTDRRAIVTWAEFEVPDAPRRGVVTWAELEVPNEPRRGVVTWAEFETPDAPRRAVVTWAELETPDAPRRAVITWAEFEVPDLASTDRRAVVTWAEFEVPNEPRRGVVTWVEFEVPDVAVEAPAPGGGRGKRRKVPRYEHLDVLLDEHGRIVRATPSLQTERAPSEPTRPLKVRVRRTDGKPASALDVSLALHLVLLMEELWD